jgi:hypothetical protein
MAGRIIRFFREYQFIFSLILTIIGIIGLIVGSSGMWFPNFDKGLLGFNDDLLEWSLYILLICFIVFIAGVWYLYTYLKNKKFIKDELKTNKRSEFLKKHNELANIVRHMPSKYQKMIKEKDEELNIK